MDLRYTAAEEKFRQELRAWLAEAVPAHGATPPKDDWEARRAYDTGWQRKLFDAGYAGINWPKEFGGRGVGPIEQIVWNQYTIRIPNGRRDEVRAFMAENKVGSETYYPVPLHLQECFRQVGCGRGSLPVTEQAAEEVYLGKLDAHFPVDVYQTGSGTSTNMNANEVIANAALLETGRKAGQYDIVEPHDHLNMSQSTNDAYPTALKLAIATNNDGLVHQIEQLVAALRNKGNEFIDVLKMGRTEMQDAVPMTVGQEFHAMASALEGELGFLRDADDVRFHFQTISMHTKRVLHAFMLIHRVFSRNHVYDFAVVWNGNRLCCFQGTLDITYDNTVVVLIDRRQATAVARWALRLTI